jgi:hypothetical protein
VGDSDEDASNMEDHGLDGALSEGRESMDDNGGDARSLSSHDSEDDTDQIAVM